MMKTIAMFLLLTLALVCVQSGLKDELEELRDARKYHKAMAQVVAYQTARLYQKSKEILFLVTVLGSCLLVLVIL